MFSGYRLLRTATVNSRQDPRIYVNRQPGNKRGTVGSFQHVDIRVETIEIIKPLGENLN